MVSSGAAYLLRLNRTAHRHWCQKEECAWKFNIHDMSAEVKGSFVSSSFAVLFHVRTCGWVFAARLRRVFSCCCCLFRLMDFCSLWITRSLFVLAITTVIYWTGVLLELFTLEVTSTWKSTSCSGFSILTFSSLNRFLAAMLLYNSDLNGFNVTSWRMAQQGWVAGSLYPFWTRGCPSLHTLFPSVLHMETYNLISTASDWQLWGSYNIISTASVWQLWSQTFQCDLYDRHRWW